MIHIPAGQLFHNYPDFEIRQVQNGWILYFYDEDGERPGVGTKRCYVFRDAFSLGEFIQRHAKVKDQRREPGGGLRSDLCCGNVVGCDPQR